MTYARTKPATKRRRASTWWLPPIPGVTWFLGTLECTVGGQSLVARMRYTRTWAHDDQSGWKIIAAHAVFPTDGDSATDR